MIDTAAWSQLLEAMMARVNSMTDMALVIETLEPAGALRGKRVSFTGHLGRPRKDLIKLVELAGGVFDEQPQYWTTYLVTNRDWNAGSTVRKNKSLKLIKAERNGTKIISEEEFYDLIIAKMNNEIA